MAGKRKRLLALIGAAVLTVSSVLPAGPTVYAEDEGSLAVQLGYSSDFTGWQIAEGSRGTVGAADDGLQISGLDGIAFDQAAPDIKDGVVTARIKASQLSNFGLMFRYQDPDNLVALGFGNNNVMYVSRNGGEELYNIKDFSYNYGNQDYLTLSCQFEGDQVQLYVDDNLAAEWSGMNRTEAGKVGFRTWNGAKDITVESINAVCTYKSDLTGWQIAKGSAGTVEPTDGGLQISGLVQGIAFDQAAPDIRDGVVTAEIKVGQLNNFGLMFRYQDPDNLVALGFGNNNVMYVSRNGGKELYNIKDFSYNYSNQDYLTLSCQFEGDQVKLFVDDVLAAEWSGMNQTEAGKIGFRTWNADGTKDITVKSASCTGEVVQLNTGALARMIEEARAADQNLYTEESYAALQTALQKAEDVLANAVEQSAIDAAYKELGDAFQKLELKDKSGFAGWKLADGSKGTLDSQNDELQITGLEGVAFDDASAKIQDGVVTAELKASKLNNFGLMFRYKDPDNLIALGFGNNNVMYVSRNGGQELYNIKDFSYDYGNQDYLTLKCQFKGDRVKLFVDDKLAAEWSGMNRTEAGKTGFRTWNGTKDITVRSISCTDGVNMLETAALAEAIEQAKALDKDSYTEESYAALLAAIQEAEAAMTNAEVQSEIDTAKAKLDEAVKNLAARPEDRITADEDYSKGTGGVKWSEQAVVKDKGLALTVKAGECVFNQNEEMQKVQNGLYTYRIKTDSKGRFGVAFNGNVLYSDEPGIYKLRTPKADTKAAEGRSVLKADETVFAEDNLKLEADTWYELKIMKSMETLRVYVNGAVVDSKEIEGLGSEPGGIGLYNPTDASAEMLIRECNVYELYTYFNDFKDETSLGNWELENAEVSHIPAGEIDGSGEAKIQLNGVARAIAKDTPKISDGIYEFDLIDKAQEGSGRFGFLFRATGLDKFEFPYHDTGSTWGVRTKVPGSATEWAQEASFANGVAFTENEKHHVRMEAEADSIKLWLDDQYIGAVSLTRPSYKGHFGFMKWYMAAEFRLDNLSIQETVPVVPEIPEAKEIELENKSMRVTFDENFPYIVKYQMNGKELTGNPKGQNAVVINGDVYYPVVKCTKKDNQQLVYHLEIPSVKAAMDVKYVLDRNDIKMNVENIKENGSVKIQTFHFKDDVLATTSSKMDDSSMGMTVYTTGPTGYATMQDTLWSTMNDAIVGGTSQSYAMLASDGLAMTVNNSTINTKARFSCNVYEDGGNKIGQIGNGTFDYVLAGSEKTYAPSAVITICEDCNGDGEVNYQDAAVNYKHIRSEVYGDDVMKDNLIWIAYNSVSQAQEPFMRSLDLGKEVYNFTDGFEQMIMHKGYQAEGHDTHHGLYAYNTGERQGGHDDFKAVMDAGKKYGIKYGIHVNVNEHHVESMNENVMRKPLSPGWGLWSQAYWVDQGADVTSGNREQRLRMLKEEYPNLAFIYYDIYGNDGAPVWMGQSLAEVTNDMGMILATEFNGPLEQQAAFTHWGNDPDYANVGNESKLMRYFKNDTDIYIGNALLMGNKMLNIGTWQAMNTDMKRGVDTFYNNVLPTKYLQHFDLLDYEDDYAQFSNGIKTERKGNMVELTKDGKKMAYWDWKMQTNSYGQEQEVTGNTTLLIPWYAKGSKDKDPEEASKLYYWNPAGGTTTWDVSIHDGWKDGTTADIYRLTTDVKEKVGTVTVSGGKITLNQEAGYGYVLYPGGEAPEKAVSSFGEGTPLNDPNFINDNGKAWTLTGNASLKKDGGYNPYLAVEGEGSASQTMKGLKPGKTYTVYGFADIENESSLNMSVTIDGKTYENAYGPSELIYRGIPRYADQNKTTQKVRIVFDVPEGTEDAELKFDGHGTIRLQDIRVWENLTRTPQITDPDMSNYILYEDFENVEQGYGPFILDSRHTGWDAPVQIAEYRESRPEYGEDWEQYSDYVANGRYSLKTDIGGNGFDKGGTSNGIIYRSIPGYIKFEPNTEYEINFKYVTGVDDRHNIQVRDKDGNVIYEYAFKATEREEGKHSLATAEQTARFTTGDRDDYYIVVNLINNQAGLEPSIDENGSLMERCFLSLDDISIKKPVAEEGVDKTKLEDAITASDELEEKNYTEDTWKAFADALAKAREVLADENATQEEIDAALSELNTCRDALAENSGEGETADKSALEEAITKAEVKEEKNYTEDTWKVFADALAKAREVLVDENATQEEVDAALSELNAGMDALVRNPGEGETVDKVALEEAVKAAETKEEKDYTEDTWKVFADALAKAREVLADENATQEEVDAALSELNAGMDTLKKAENSGSDTNGSGSGNKDKDSNSTGGGTDKNSNSSSGKAVRTGDTAMPFVYAGLVIGSLIVSEEIIRRRLRKNN